MSTRIRIGERVSASLARCRAYTLLGDLFQRGLTPTSAAAWGEVPLARGALADLPLDLAAEVHTRVVLLDLPLRASAWLSDLPVRTSPITWAAAALGSSAISRRAPQAGRNIGRAQTAHRGH